MVDGILIVNCMKESATMKAETTGDGICYCPEVKKNEIREKEFKSPGGMIFEKYHMVCSGRIE